MQLTDTEARGMKASNMCYTVLAPAFSQRRDTWRVTAPQFFPPDPRLVAQHG